MLNLGNLVEDSEGIDPGIVIEGIGQPIVGFITGVDIILTLSAFFRLRLNHPLPRLGVAAIQPRLLARIKSVNCFTSLRFPSDFSILARASTGETLRK